LLPPLREEAMAVASVSKITAASPTSFDAAVQEGLSRANKTLRGITGLHVIEQKASVRNGKIDEFRVTMEVTFILEG
jgi:dodecin